MLLVERLELGDMAHRPPHVDVDAMHLPIARGRDDIVAPFHPDHGHRPLDQVIVVVPHFELVVAVAIMQMMCYSEIHSIFSSRSEYGHCTSMRPTTRSVRTCEDESIWGGTEDFVSEHPESYGLHHAPSPVLIHLDCQRLVVETTVDGRDMVEIPRGIDIVAKALDGGRVGVGHYTYGAPNLRRRELTITISHPRTMFTLTSCSKREITNFLNR